MQAVDSAGNNFDFPAASSNAVTYTATYPIAFPSSSSLKAANFKLALNLASFLLSSYGKIDYVSLEVTYFNSNKTGYSVSNPLPIETLLKLTEILRYDIVKIFYVSSNVTNFNFSVFPVTYDTASTSVISQFTTNVYAISGVSSGLSGNEWSLGSGYSLGPSQEELAAAQIPTATPNFVGQVAHYSINLNPGYYAFEVTYNTNTPQANQKNNFIGRISFQTDPYACPYNSDFGDYFSNFQGCSIASSAQGIPCASFNSITQTCSLCIQGYTLVNGSCYADTSCPARQYFHFGSCYNVSATCGDFNKFTGDCLSCADPANYDLVNGSCVHKTVTCAANQWQKNYVCYNASATCATFNPSTGACLTCVSNLYQLNADGTCTLIVVVCPQGQYAVGLNCVTIPAECLNFDTTLQKCLACIQGYFVQNGTCQKIVCPARQVPSKYGIFCVDVSSLCGTYDSLTGNCLTCSQNGYTVRNGACVQIGSALAGCQERQTLGYGPCENADANCKTFNLITNACEVCNDGYYIDYTGKCALSAKCGVGQWSVNGQCIGIPDNCLSVDSLGLCTTCVSSNYRLQQGQCVFFKTCTGQQYLNSAGQCVDVNANCGTWNPSNGQCITCKDASVSPTSGICCPSGQVYSGNTCVDATTLQNSYQSATGSSCLIRHPSLNFCVKCAQGYAPDYTIPFGCAAQ